MKKSRKRMWGGDVNVPPPVTTPATDTDTDKKPGLFSGWFGSKTDNVADANPTEKKSGLFSGITDLFGSKSDEQNNPNATGSTTTGSTTTGSTTTGSTTDATQKGGKRSRRRRGRKTKRSRRSRRHR